MSRLVTQLVTDQPAIVLVGENTILREKLAFALQGKNVVVDFVEPTELSKSVQKMQQAYKVLWVCDQEKSSTEYLEYIQVLSQIKTPLLIVLPVFSGISSCESTFLHTWVTETNQQLQFIIDCNYYLPGASFVFGQDVVGNNVDISIFNYILKNCVDTIIRDPVSPLHFISIDDFVAQVVEFVFIPKKQISMLITSRSVDSTHFIGLVKKLYDTYHAVSLEVIQDKVVFSKLLPFSASEKIIATDTRAIATYLVKTLPAPVKKEEQLVVLPEPSSTTVVQQQEYSATQIISQPAQTASSVPLVEQFGYEPEVSLQAQSQIISERTTQETYYSQTTQVTEPQLPQITRTLEPIPQQVQAPMNQSLELTFQQTNKQPAEDLDLTSEIQRIFKDTRTEKKVERVEKIVKSTKKITKKSKRKTKLFYGGLLSVGMAVGMLLLATVYLISGSILKKQVVSFLTTTAQAQDLTHLPGAPLTKTTGFVAAQTNLYSQIIELAVIAQNSVLVTIVEQFAAIPTILEEADKASKNLVLNILSASTGDTTELTEILTQSVSKAYEKLSLVQATLEQLDLGEHSAQQQAVVDQIGKKIQEIRAGLEIHQQLQQVLPGMVGVSEKRTYALLLQNNQELRPTGGFIQAVALLNFDKGSLVSYQVYSVYDLDRKLPGQVIPPEEIRTHLGETNWYLRDANWDPDFPKTSKQVAWFIEKALGVTVDGVIGMNVFSLEDLVEAVGPLDLPEYNEVITHRNIEERMEFHSEVVLVDSPDSIDYSVKILTKILEQMTRLKEDSVAVFLSGLQNSLGTKQTLLYSTRESEQSILQSLSWTGTVTPPSCPSRLSVVNCLVDTVAQVEANIGINKANYYLDRTISHEIVVSKTNAHHTRSIVFNNKAQSNAWPKGTYQSFQRFYVNSDVIVEKVLINGSELNEKQITQTQEDGFKIIGVRVDVPIQKQVELKLVYSTPLTTADSFSYVFYNRKQPGLDADPFTVRITHSPEIKPVLIAPSATIMGNTITFSAQSLDDAALFGVQFE